jgi:hypothetical protein
MRKIFSMAAITAATLIVQLVWHFVAYAHDHSHPELNSWFESLKSGKGPCCSDADGKARCSAAPVSQLAPPCLRLRRARPESQRPRRSLRARTCDRSTQRSSAALLKSEGSARAPTRKFPSRPTRRMAMRRATPARSVPIHGSARQTRRSGPSGMAGALYRLPVGRSR